MDGGYLAEVRLFAGNFAPRAWAFCQGQLLPISQNSALFSLLGTIYGGDGRTTFGLPDLRGRVAVGSGNGPGLNNYKLGSKGGNEQTYLNVTNLPAHNHEAVMNVDNGDGPKRTPSGKFLSGDVGSTLYADSIATAATLNWEAITVGNTGNGVPFSNRSPFLTLNYIICTQGLFPSRS